MNFTSAHLFLSGHCEGSPWRDETPVAKAIQAASQHEELAFLLARQRALDAQAAAALQRIELSADALEDFSQIVAQPKAAGDWKRQLVQPAILAPFCSLLLICGVVLYFMMLKARNFAGYSAAQEMVATAQTMSGNEMEPVSKSGAETGDWFFLKYGLEDFGLHAPFEKTHIVGARLMKQSGHPIAQMAADPNLLFYIFRTADFEITLPDDAWHVFEQDQWVAAIARQGTMAVMVTLPGETADMNRFLKKHPL